MSTKRMQRKGVEAAPRVAVCEVSGPDERIGSIGLSSERCYRREDGGLLEIRELSEADAENAVPSSPRLREGTVILVGEQIATAGEHLAIASEAPCIFMLMFDVPDSEIRSFDDWYQNEHEHILLECQEWLAIRRFRVAAAHRASCNRLVLHYLADKEALTSDSRLRAQRTPAGSLLKQRPWFQNGQRLVLSRC